MGRAGSDPAARIARGRIGDRPLRGPWLLLAMWCALCCQASCHRDPAPRRVEPRVVSLSPNMTETIFALGAGQSLVGRSRHCDHPAAATRLPAVGGFADPSVEAIVALRPTLVVGARGPAGPGLAQTLSSHGIDTYFPAIESVADIRSMVLGLGERLGQGPRAQALTTEIAEAVERIRQAAAALPAVRAVLVFDASPLVVAGPGGFPDELLRLGGGQNVIDRGGAYPTLGLERLLALQPEVIIDATVAGTGQPSTRSQPSLLGQKPGWAELDAVRRGRVRVLRGSAALRPGPRIAEGLAELGQALHDRDFSP